MTRSSCLIVAVALMGMPSAVRSLADTPTGEEFFEKEVRPLLVEHCARCHGEEKPKAGLKLSSRMHILKGGEGGPAAVPGKPGESLIVGVLGYEGETKMPPKGKLNDRAIATFAKWVEMGMPWPDAKAEAASSAGRPYQISEAQRQFWSFQPVSDPAVPSVKDASWPKGDIDRFLLSAMEAKGLKPAPPADKRTLIRRASFDLTGLPPSVAEVNAFLADESPEAFAKVVDRLLASPQYGERWGRHWLDLVRYADARDARGIGGDGDVTEAWRYRDWVVSAFNRDLPYNQFVRDQIAGDVLPGPVPGDVNAEGMIATGLLMIGEWGAGDADKEKMMTDIVDDQIDVVGRAFLGLTIACARCHDHKFDPIPTADYYGLAGIFFSTKILPDPGNKTQGSPILHTPTATRAEQDFARKYQGDVADLEARLKAESDLASEALGRSLLKETGNYLLAAWDRKHPVNDSASRSVTEISAERKLHATVLRNWLTALDLGGDGPLLAKPARDLAGIEGVSAWLGESTDASVTINANPREIARLTFKLPARSVNAHPSPTRGVTVTWESPISGSVQISGKLVDGDPVCGDGIAWNLVHRGAFDADTLASGDIANGGSQPVDGGKAVEVRRGDPIRLTILPKGGHACDTTGVTLTIRASDGSATWDLADDVVSSPMAGNPHADRLGHENVWRFSEAADSRPDGPLPGALAVWAAVAKAGDRRAVEAASKAIQAILDRDPKDAEANLLRRSLTGPKGPLDVKPQGDSLSAFPPEIVAKITKLRDDLGRLKASPPPPAPMALVALEGGVPRSAHEGFHDARIHIRGNYQRLGEVVPRHFPRIVAGDSQATISQGSGRKELAEWVSRDDHPLTARVMVNRIWQHHFGEGIVRTPSNFGKLGERPSHPELLDWLARKFVTSGWSIKSIHRLLLLSSAYQQASTASTEALRIDPEDRLFGRMNRRRLESEAVRDSVLAASGRLDRSMGGPSYRDFSTPRRTLYFMTIRSDRSSFGPLFDAADATAMVDRRTISTVAPQALFLMNDPFMLDQSRALAESILAEPLPGDRERIDRLYEKLYGRPPRDEERSIGLEAVAGADRKAAWEAYCQVLLCGNEFLYID